MLSLYAAYVTNNKKIEMHVETEPMAESEYTMCEVVFSLGR